MSKRRFFLKKVKVVLQKIQPKWSDLRRDRQKYPAHAWGRVKTVCICLLLAGNIALLAVFGAVKGYDWYLSVQTRQQIDEKLAEKGILCGSSVYHALEDCPQSYTLRTDHTIQKAFAQALLTGESDAYAEKGNTTVWVGDNGSVSWAASGDVQAAVTLSSIPEPQTEEQVQQLVQDVLDHAGIRVHSSSFSVTQDETGYTVKVSQELEQAELLGCGMEFHIAPGNVVTVDGRWCTGEVQPLTVRELASYSSAHMIFSLVSAQSDIAQIINAQPAYVLSDRSGGRFTAIPCWRFVTSDGDYVLNILSGDVVSAEELESNVDSGTDTDTAADAGTGTAVDAGTGVNAGVESNANTDTAANAGTDVDTGTDTNAGTDTDAVDWTVE